MKKQLILFGSILILFSLSSCKDEVCRECIRCMSYDSDQTLMNEVRECNLDTAYLNGFELGFMEGANDNGFDAICLKLGVICEKEE